MTLPTIETAFILGAGLGSRLRPLTEDRPKPLLPVGGRPMITYAMDHLFTVGVRRLIVNTHHRPEVYKEAFPNGQWRGRPIVFRYEPVLLDTAGGLKNIGDLLDHGAPLLVYNGDILTDLPLPRLLAAHRACGKEVTLALRSTGTPLNVSLNDRGEVCDMRHLLGDPGTQSCLFTGIYILEGRFLDRLEAGRIESVVLPFVRLIREEPGAIAGVVIDDGYWYDIGSHEEYAKVRGIFEKDKEQ